MNEKHFYRIKTFIILTVFLHILFISNCTNTSVNIIQTGMSDVFSGEFIQNSQDGILSDKANADAEIENAQRVVVFPQLGHSEGISSMAFSPDGKYIVSSSLDQTLHIWDIERSRELRTFSGINRGIISVAWSPDNLHIVSGAWDGSITIWDVNNADIIKSFPAHHGAVSSVIYDNKGEQILSGGFDGSIKLWDKYGTFISTVLENEAPVENVIVVDNFIISGSRDGCIKIWDKKSENIINSLNFNKGVICSLSSTSDGLKIISGYFDGSIVIWNTENNSARTIQNAHRGSVNSVNISSDGKFAVSCSFDAIIKLWDIESGSLLKQFIGHENEVNIVIFSLDDKYLVSASWDGTIRRWDRNNELNHFILAGNAYYLNYAVFHPKKPLAATASTNFTNSTGIVTFWDIQNGRLLNTFTAHDFPINQIEFNAEGDLILTNSLDGKIKVWETESFQLIRVFDGKKNEVSSAGFNDEGNCIVTGLYDGTVLVWDVMSGEELLRFKEDVSITAISYDNDGNILIGLSNGTIMLRDAKTGVELKRFENGHLGHITSLAQSSNKKFIASGSWDTIVIIWDAETAKSVWHIEDHGDPVRSVAFSPDGERLATSSGSVFDTTGDRTIRIWDITTKENIRVISDHWGNVNSVAYSSDGNRILSCSYDGTTRLWDVATGKEIASFISFTDDEWIVITPDGYYNSSPKGDQYLNVRIENNVYGMDQFAETFYRPDVVERRLQALPDPLGFRPEVRIQTTSIPPDLRVTAGEVDPVARQVVLSITATDDIRQISDVQIIINGRLVGGEELMAVSATNLEARNTRLVALSEERQYVFTVTLQLDPSLNRIEIVAANDFNYGLGLLTISVPQAETPPKGDMWLLAIGVDDYADNPLYQDLQYAVSDAQRIIDAFKAQEGNRFDNVHTRLITDNEATKQNILYNIDDFFRRAKRNDVAALYVASHGKTDNGIYYFFPSDTVFTDDGKFDIDSVINIEELTHALDIPGRKIVMLDTCESGGVDTNRLVHTLRNRSTVIFTASQEDEFARESSFYGGGFFTTGMTDGLKGEAAENGVVMINSLENYVAERVSRMSRNRQRPATLVPDGYKEFVISVVE